MLTTLTFLSESWHIRWPTKQNIKLFRFLSSSPKRPTVDQQTVGQTGDEAQFQDENKREIGENPAHDPTQSIESSEQQQQQSSSKGISNPTHANASMTTKHSDLKKTTTNTKDTKESFIEKQLGEDISSYLSSGDLKKTGNKLCALHKYDEAISYYSRAIMRNPNEPVYFSNRALCNLKLTQWDQAIQDSRRALELDPSSIKAHFYLGQALTEIESYEEALKHLQRAHEIAKEKKMNFGDDIAYQIRLARRRRWNKTEETNEKLENEMRDYLLDLVKKDRDEKVKLLADKSMPSSSTESSKQHATESDIKDKFDTYLDKINSIFNNLAIQRRKRDVPDYLCGKISFEIMQDPVITPSGITYDRTDIEEHLKRVGHFDPVTRQPLRLEDLISNLAMKEVIDSYLNENEWALYY